MTGTEYVWATLRDEFSRRVSDTPSAKQEARILDVFMERPALVAEAVEHVAGRFDAGAIRAAWPVLVRHVEQAAEVASKSAVRVTDAGDRERAVDRARQWLRTVGLHYDRESEVEDDLFGVRGPLRWWGADEGLRAEMLDAWRGLRPDGERVEREAEERAAAWVATTGAKRKAEAAARRRTGAAAGGAEGDVPQDRGSGLDQRLLDAVRSKGERLQPEETEPENGATGQEVGLTAAALANPFLDE